MTGSNGGTVKQNYIGPNEIGVASHSSIGAQIHANMMTDNALAGVTLVNTDRSKIDGNSINGSRNGIFLDAQSTKNTILYNNVLKNDVDLNNADGLPLNINGNELLNNECTISQPSGYCR
jgi:parallel beta-helix repeat protein